MRKQRSGSVWMILPLYIFTLIFVAGPLLYVLALSFAKPAPTHGIEWTFSWDNYRKILEPVYLEYLCRFLPAGGDQYFSHLSDRLSIWLFYGKAF